jgi:hypothetical protein
MGNTAYCYSVDVSMTCCLVAVVVLSLVSCRCLAPGVFVTLLPPWGCLFLVAYRRPAISSYRGCACDICDCYRLPTPWLDSSCDSSSTAAAAPSLRSIVQSESLISYQLLQCTIFPLFCNATCRTKPPKETNVSTSPAFTLPAALSSVS